MTKKQTSFKNAASTFLQTGIDYFEREDYETARIFLGLAGKLFSDLNDEWNVRIVNPWYESTLEKLGLPCIPNW